MRSRALKAVVRALEDREIPYALFGATAMPVYGAARATLDADLLVTDRAILDDATWAPLKAARVTYEIRRADEASDPIAGVVRVGRKSRLPVDVVMPRGRWLRAVLARARTGPRAVVAGVELPVVSLPDLILLKLDAGGPDDIRDVGRLLDANRDGAAELIESVERELGSVPDPASDLWARIKAERGLA